MTPAELQNLLGVKAVLLPIKKGVKYPTFKKWQETTFADTQKEAYQKKLESHRNTGVLLGKASEHLCSIDFDDDEALNDFLKLNPTLNQTLRTRGKRGANLWIILIGDYPKSHIFKNASGNPAGEWRANGNQTVIQGTHPEGVSYQILVNALPAHISYDSIQWGSIQFNKCHVEDISQSNMESWFVGSPKCLNAQKPKSLKKPVSRLPCSHETMAEREARQTEEEQAEALALENLKKDKLRFAQYHTLVSKYAKKATHKTSNRNSLTLKIVSFLFENVGETSIEPLAMIFYDLNKSHFSGKTSCEEHRNDVLKQIKCVSERWHASLDEVELEHFSALECPYQQNLFRICRRLAMIEVKGFPAGVFYLSEKKAAERLGTAKKTAGAKLGDLRKLWIISIKKKGTNGKIASERLATTYDWLLSRSHLDQLSENKEPDASLLDRLT